MTCVWDSLIAGINKSDMCSVFSLEKSHFVIRPEKFVSALKLLNRPTPNVKWQCDVLREQELNENQEWVKNYNVSCIGNGHDTGTSDPFFFLICELFNISILHNYRGHEIRYDYPTPRYIVRICSNSGHMNTC